MRGAATSSVSLTFSRWETKEDCAESSCETLAEGSCDADGLWDAGFENSEAETDGFVVIAERGLSPLATRRLGKATPPLVERWPPGEDWPLLRLRSLRAPSLSVCEEADAADDRGGVKALRPVVLCSIEVAASSSAS